MYLHQITASFETQVITINKHMIFDYLRERVTRKYSRMTIILCTTNSQENHPFVSFKEQLVNP